MRISIPELNIIKPIKGIIHLGAHECEERNDYINNFNLDDSKILWFDALPYKVNSIKQHNPSIQIYNLCLSNEDDKDVSFMVTNNFQSSSMLNLKTHLQEHPDVYEIGRIELKTKTLNSFFKENSFAPENYNFMNLDLQGAELLALQGSSDILPYIDYIYTEVNEKELYENCALLPQLDEYLQKFGFKRTQTKMTQYGWGDALYIK